MVFHSLSRVQFFATPWTEAHQAHLSFTISWTLFKLKSTELVMSSNHFILCWPLLLLPSIFPSIRVFFNELALHIRWPKYWSFSISPSNEYSGLIFFTIDWLDLLTVQGTYRVFSSTTVQSINSLAVSLLYVPTHLYMTTEKTIALIIQIFVSKVISLLFNMLFRFVIAFLPRNIF